jgi:hypothetical protein
LREAVHGEHHAERERAVERAERGAHRGREQHAVTNEPPRADVIAEHAAQELSERIRGEVRRIDATERDLTHTELVVKRLFDDAEASTTEVVGRVG